MSLPKKIAKRLAQQDYGWRQPDYVERSGTVRDYAKARGFDLGRFCNLHSPDANQDVLEMRMSDGYAPEQIKPFLDAAAEVLKAIEGANGKLAADDFSHMVFNTLSTWYYG